VALLVFCVIKTRSIYVFPLLISMANGVGYFYKAKVVSVYDGDTCRADIALGFGVVLANKTIRLANIDTAEIRSKDKETALVARDRLRELILGKEVVLQTIKDRTGKYGRIIGTIYSGGRNINEMLIEEGLAERLSRKKRSDDHMPKKEKTSPPREKPLAVKIEIPESVLKSVQPVSGSSE